jgi:serine-type D-Ala-D-Ala carboxypeptidase (penicillin-binding protein 5/6)
VLAAVLLFAGAAYLAVALLRTLPGATVSTSLLHDRFRGRPPLLAWPRHGEAAVGIQGVAPIGSHGSNDPTPIASVAKVMTAYVVLRDHRLRGGGASGPDITVNSGDVGVYRTDLAAGQSVVLVRAGERITERQALEGLLLPSGNNLAELLARWDAGSQAAFVAKMNAQARTLGMSHTHYADASGVSVRTVSTASDQLRVAMRALELPAFAQIVAMPQATLPVAGRQYNLDGLLGKDGIVGIKTGSTSQAGGCFMFAAHEQLGGRPVTVVGTVLDQRPSGGQPTIIAAAFSASTALLASVRPVLATREIVRRHTTVGWVDTPWSTRDPVAATRPVRLVGWPGLRIHETIVTAPHLAAPLSAGETVGTAVLAAGDERETVRLVATRPLPQASTAWRVSHP